MPTPARTTRGEGVFRVSLPLRVRVTPTSRGAMERLSEVLPVKETRRGGELRFVTDTSVVDEGYKLTITTRGIEVRAAGHAGFVYAVSTLRQLYAEGAFPVLTIDDRPRMKWRALMLDSGRQYQSISKIKSLIDLCASLKLNRFHWHLTEGLGWRLEIKKYPRLAREGGRVATGEEQQGYYTQDEVRRVVAYAQVRAVEIVPEIDLPGHAEAALNVYPHLGCFNERASIPSEGFTPQIFCAGKDSTLRFLEDVLAEVVTLFPSPYIHLGGDEAPKDNWRRCPDCQRRIREEHLADEHDLQRWLATHLASWLQRHGRKAILWEDALYGNQAKTGLPEGTLIQWWNYRGHGDEAVRLAERAGLQVVASPNYYCYLNFPTTPWRGYKRDRTFNIEDIRRANPADTCRSKAIVGIEAALWTDYGLTENMLDERLMPRLEALAEQMW